MARPSSAPGATHSLEWVVGLEPLPTPVGDDHPEILLLLAGGVVDFHLGPPGALLERAAQHLHDALAKAERDGAQRPTSIRVRSAQLAAALGASEPPLPTIACAATPEIDAAVAEMASRLAHDEPSYLSVDIEPKHVAAFFAAAARLYRAAPWSALPSGTRVLDTDALGAQGAVASLVGRTAAQFALVLFADMNAFHTFLAATPEDALPAHTSFSFVATAELHRAHAEEIELWGWELASAAAAPQVLVIDAGVTRAATLHELTVIEAALLAVERGCG